MDQYQEVFKQEAEELLLDLEESLLELEETPDDMDLVARAFRAMHTIKGSGAMFGFDAIASFTHELETAFDRVRSGKLTITRGLIDVGLQSKDHIRGLLGGTAGPEAGQPLLEVLQTLLRGETPPPVAPAPAPVAAAAPATPAARGTNGDEGGVTTYRIRFQPKPGLLASGNHPLAILREVQALGTAHVVVHTSRVPPLESLDPEECLLSWDVILTTDRGENAVRDVFIFVLDHCELRVEPVDDASVPQSEADYKKLGDILLERGDITRQGMEEALREQKRFGEILQEKGMVPPEKVQSALVEQQAVRDARQQRENAEAAMSIRVPANKLDALVDLVGELVIAQARLSQSAIRRDDPELVTIAEDVERLTGELRDNTLNIRMVPIGSSFGRFRRLVRDLAAELGKEVDLVTEGAETELDKTVIERLGDPLVHLIRNSMDHGIQPPAEREAAGKPRKGTVRLTARHSGASVVIAIADDGRGMDPEVLRRKAVERGLIAADAVLTDKELFNLTLLPGFSTAATISSVSGRGVGMDVVKRAIESLRGSVDIESRVGKGTTVSITLPLTLAIIEGLLVEVGSESFVLPLAVVEECIELTREDIRRTHGKRMAQVRGELVPYVRLREWFSMAGEWPEIEQIVITEIDGVRLGFVVDRVIGQHQTVIKSLGKAYRDVEGLSGATILGDGAVALIVDVPKLYSAVQEAEYATTH